MSMSSYYPAVVASQMKRGLSNEIAQICEIGKVLRDLGNSRREVNYYLVWFIHGFKLFFVETGFRFFGLG